jgi:ABC-type polysaccharide/polyol phosphate transport system ATPase subunit
MTDIYSKNPPNRDPRIEAAGLSKRFRLQNGPRVILNLLLSLGAKRGDVLEALKGIDISVVSGEVVALIGKNGSGKSTLLKILAGLHVEDAGIIRMHGRSLYLSGLHFASNPYMTVRENIFLMGTVFGLRRKEIRDKMKEILDFSGLPRFADVETLKLSSGMQTRLNVSTTFYCMEQIRPSILLLDEVLSVGGDIEFQAKSLEKIQSLVRGGAAVLIATHDLSFVEKFCDRAIWLEAGAIQAEGEAAAVARKYERAHEATNLPLTSSVL